MTRYRSTYATVDLKAIQENCETIYKLVKKPLIAILKANAYGHGYKEVANCLKDNKHVSLFAVATLKEAEDLRKLGVSQDILVLGPIPLEDVEIAIKYDITLTILSFEYLDKIQSLHLSSSVKVHIALDTGMSRIGFRSKKEFEHVLETINPEKVNVEGVFTHFATADDENQNHEYEKQLDKFKAIVGNLQFKYIHCDNTAAMMFHHSNYGNLGRIGIGLYGIDPRGEENPNLKQAMSLYTKVAMVKKINKGDKVGYGMTYEAKEDEFIATLPIGYADGLLRINQNRHVYINGKEYPIVGRVCMDQCMVKVDETVKADAIVEIFGKHISLARMAKETQTIPYEIICILSQRVERYYE